MLVGSRKIPGIRTIRYVSSDLATGLNRIGKPGHCCGKKAGHGLVGQIQYLTPRSATEEMSTESDDKKQSLGAQGDGTAQRLDHAGYGKSVMRAVAGTQ